MRIIRGERRRPGFTFIELLVVITIVAVLVALSAAATLRFMSVQQQNNTQTTINKVYDAINKSYKANYRKFYEEPIPDQYLPSILAMAQNASGNDPNAMQRARVIWIKLRFRQLFPISFNEALISAPPAPLLPALPTYQATLTKLGVTGSTLQTQSFESAACLLMALQQGQSGSGINAEDLAGGQSVSTFPLLSGQNIQAFIDSYGQPLTFSRWPTGCVLLNPAGPQAGFNDPLDPLGYLANNTWLNSPQASLYKTLLHQLPASGGMSYKLVPMLVSNGPDKSLGLDPATLTVLNNTSDDDIYSTTP